VRYDVPFDQIKLELDDLLPSCTLIGPEYTEQSLSNVLYSKTSSYDDLS